MSSTFLYSLKNLDLKHLLAAAAAEDELPQDMVFGFPFLSPSSPDFCFIQRVVADEDDTGRGAVSKAPSRD